MSGHALLSPSSASRWLACTPSAVLEAELPNTSNAAADEGTLAHALCELLLNNYLKRVNTIVYKKQLKIIQNNALYSKEMLEHCENYVAYISDKLHALEDPTIFVEEKIDLTDFVPDGFGTGDNIIVGYDATQQVVILDINDLKYGKGVVVDAYENKQLMLYGLGAFKKYSLMYDINIVRMSIFQPRLSNYTSFEMSAEDLVKWGEEYVKPKAELAFIGAGEFVAGSHCKFCKLRNSCKALANDQMQAAKKAFAEPNTLTDQELADILEKAADVKAWLSSIQEYALAEALKGKKWPGHKLVAGRSNRVLTQPEEIVKVLKKAKIESTLYLTEPKLLGIGALEKNIGKAELDKLIAPYIIKPAGAPALVPTWDKRPEIASLEDAQNAFKDCAVA